MTDLAFTSANQLVEQFRRKTLSPVEVTRALLARVASVDRKLNAFCVVDEGRALADARAAEARWQRGEPAGLLDGVPVSVKDLVLTRGWPTLRGSKIVDPNQSWEEDAPSVRHLRAHGAVLFGKTTTSEFGWKGVADNPVNGITRNPWNTDLTPGGSSGGAGAAVAAGLGPLAIGTDAGGSIRIPASFTGIFGHKPSFGRVGLYPITPFAIFASVGPMTRTVGDAALMLTVISQPDSRDWNMLPYGARDYRDGLEQGVRGLRIAYSATLGYAQVEPEVAALADQAVKVFAELGAEIEAIDPGFPDPTPIRRPLWCGALRSAFRHLSPAQTALLDPGLQGWLEEACSVDLMAYLAADLARAALGQQMRQFHEKYDLLLTPTMAVSPFPVGVNSPTGKGGPDATYWTPFTAPFNLTRQPAATVPCGFTKAGLPAGLQIVGPMHDDAMVLRAARAFEQARPWAEKRPAAA